MNEELIGELHIVASGVQSKQRRELLEKAADAIEQLEKELDRAKEWASFWEKEANEALKKFQVAVASKPRWIPVTEALPKPMTYVLLVIRRMGKEYRHDPFISTGYMSINEVDWWCSHDGSCSANHVEVTHWMPLPTPPKDETEMSGIYIKGMEMPVGCAFCEIKRRLGKIMVCPFCNEEWDIHDPMSAEYRLAGCPLIPVPPHGRLIEQERNVLLKSVPKWIPVTDRLPETPGEYMVAYHPCYWDRVHDEIKVGLDSFRGKTSWAKKKYQRVTHWMPLPEPPKEETE